MKDFLKELFEEKILLNELGDIQENKPLLDQLDLLYELLFQVKNNDLVLDVGWYPVSSPSGSFKVVVLTEKGDWENPLFVKNVKTIAELKEVLKDCKEKYDF